MAADPPPRSPLAPAAFPSLPTVAGVRLATAATGIRYKNRADLLLAVLDPGTSVAGCFTRSQTRSAPVDWCAESTKGGKARAVLVNAGNANAFTGSHGVRTVDRLTAKLGRLLHCPQEEILSLPLALSAKSSIRRPSSRHFRKCWRKPRRIAGPTRRPPS